MALVTIIDEEFAAAQDVFELRENIAGTGYFAAEESELGHWDIVLTKATDRSNLPVMGDVSVLMEDLRPQVLVLLGIAGGFCDGDHGREGIQLGDVVLADQVSYVEFLKIEPGRTFMRSYAIDHPSHYLRKTVCVPLKETFKIDDHLGGTAPPSPGPFRVHMGSIVSGEKVFGDANSDIQQTLLKPFDKALAVDMESIGMARAVCEGRSSFWYHPRYIVVRGISDFIGAANCRDTLILHWLARSAAGQGAVGMGGKACCCRQKEDNPSHNGPLMGFGSFLWLNLGPPAARSVQTPQECLLCLPRKQQANMAQRQTRLRCACVFSVDRPARSRWQGEMIRVPQRLKDWRRLDWREFASVPA